MILYIQDKCQQYKRYNPILDIENVIKTTTNFYQPFYKSSINAAVTHTYSAHAWCGWVSPSSRPYRGYMVAPAMCTPV